MRGIFGIDPGWGITAVRIVLGVIFLHAGSQKFAAGMDVTARNFAKMGIPAPDLAGPFIAGLELVGGALLLCGLLTRWASVLFVAQFVVITLYVKGFAQGFAGLRLDLLILAGSLLLFLDGPGRAALDALWLERPTVDRVPRSDVEPRVARSRRIFAVL
jgi:putative oxidoreductase